MSKLYETRVCVNRGGESHCRGGYFPDGIPNECADFEPSDEWKSGGIIGE